MPSTSEAQANLMRADYARAKRGEKTTTGMSSKQLREWVKADSVKRKMLEGFK